MSFLFYLSQLCGMINTQFLITFSFDIRYMSKDGKQGTENKEGAHSRGCFANPTIYTVSFFFFFFDKDQFL